MYGICLPFRLADWFGIDEGSLQIDDNAIPCLPTGYWCDDSDECCDGMCVLSKLSKHKVCLVIGWNDELKLPGIYGHVPLRSEDVDYLRRTYITEDVPTQPQKPRRTRVVYNEDVYDIPSLPDENILFPITDDSFMYDVVTTTEITTTTLVRDNDDMEFTSSYSTTTRFYTESTSVNNSTSSSNQDYHFTGNLTNSSTSQKPTDNSIVQVENERSDDKFPVTKNYEDLVKYGFVNPEIEGVLPRDIKINEGSNSQNVTEQNDFIELDYDYNLKSNEGNITLVPLTKNSNTSNVISTEATMSIPRENVTVIAQEITTIESFTETPGNETVQQPAQTTITPGSDVLTFLDEQLTGSMENLPSFSTANSKTITEMRTLLDLQDELPVNCENPNTTLSEIFNSFDSSTTPVGSVLTPTTETFSSQNLGSEYEFTNTNVQTITISKSAAFDSVSDGYRETDISDSTVEPQNFLRTENQLPLISKQTKMIDNCTEMNESTSFQITYTDERFSNTTVISVRYESTGRTANNSTQISETIPTRKLSTGQYSIEGKARKSKRWILKKIRKMGKFFRRKNGKHSKRATTEDYGDDLEESTHEKPLKFNIFKKNKTTSRKKSKSKKLWQGLKKLFHKKGSKTDLVNDSEPSVVDLDDIVKERSQSDYIPNETKHLVDDIDRRYETSYVLPLNETKRDSIVSNVTGWFNFGRNGRIENISVTPKTSFTESSNLIQHAHQKFHKIISKRNSSKRFSGTSTNIELYNTINTTTTKPASSSRNGEIRTQTNASQKSKRKFKLWNRFKRLFLRKKQSCTNSSDNYNNSGNDSAVINDFSIRDLHNCLNNSQKQEET